MSPPLGSFPSTQTVAVSFFRTRAPVATDDGSQGYFTGSVWVDQTAQKAYIATSVTTGAALWTEIGVATSPPPPLPTGNEFPFLSPEGIAVGASLGAGPSIADWDAGDSDGLSFHRADIINDTMYHNAAQRGMQVLPLVYGQGDAHHAGSISKVTSIVARYCRGGTFWQENTQYDPNLAPIWIELSNEPYLQNEGFWNSSGAVTGYIAWAQGWYASAVAAKQVNPNIKIILPLGVAIFGPQGWLPWTTYILNAEPRIPQVMDAWSCHPYCLNRDPNQYTDQGGGSNDFQRYNYIRENLRAHSAMQQYLAKADKWCVTEFGYHTDTPNDTTDVTEAQQADYLGKAYDILVSGGAKGTPKPFLLNYYHIKDFGDGSDDQHNYGFHFRRNGTVKPAAAAVRSRAT